MNESQVGTAAEIPVSVDDSTRLISRETCERVRSRLESFARGGGETSGAILHWWQGEMRWGRDRVTLSSDRRDLILGVFRVIDGREGYVYTNQLDDASLEAAVRAAERMVGLMSSHDRSDFQMPRSLFEYAKPSIWSDATFNLMAEARAHIAQGCIDPAAAKSMLSAGYLEVRGYGQANFRDAARPTSYAELTQAQCSMTVRDEHGSGSGWAGLSSYDSAAIDTNALTERALQKALSSRNPVALEPGRYTVILEAQAVHDLVKEIITALGRFYPEQKGAGPFALGMDPALQRYRTKLGLKIVDERVTIDHDPMDPRLGVIPSAGDEDLSPRRAVKWIDRGVLTALADDRRYALATRNENLPADNSLAFRMSGGETSVEEMIKTTKRGLLVTRFSNTHVLDISTLLMTGVTRDGLWLIENGQITKAVKNFRFTESPLFVLNSLETLGIPIPVFRPVKNPLGDEAHAVGLTPAIVPPLKARDFSFTSTIDAI